MIVGQGQLDKVLHATPEDRRGFIEEAAGILKHRRRKEKTVRKLEAMQANLPRLSDLTGEIRRQLTPLGKQAEVARRAQTVQFEVRDARSRLLADDLVQLQTALEQDVADEAALKARRAVVERGPGRRAAAPGRAGAARGRGHAQAQRRPGQLVPALRRARTAPLPRHPLPRNGGALLGAADAAPDRGPGPGAAGAAGRPGPRGAGRSWSTRSRTGATALDDRDRRAQAEAERAAAAEDKRLTATCCGPPRTAAKAWPSWPARSARHGRGSSPPRRSWAGCASRSAEPARSAAGRPRASSPRWNRQVAASRKARKASTPNTRTPAAELDDGRSGDRRS